MEGKSHRAGLSPGQGFHWPAAAIGESLSRSHIELAVPHSTPKNRYLPAYQKIALLDARMSLSFIPASMTSFCGAAVKLLCMCMHAPVRASNHRKECADVVHQLAELA